MANFTDENKIDNAADAVVAGDRSAVSDTAAKRWIAVRPRSRRFRLSSLWLRRADGTLVEDESPSRLILPYVIDRRADSLAYHESTCDLSKTLPWLREYNQNALGHKATLFDLFLWALARTSHRRPAMNRFVSGRRLYQRNKVSISFAAKKEMDLNAPLINVKLDFPPDEPFADCVKHIVSTIRQLRHGPPAKAERDANHLMRLPGFLIRAALGCYRWLDRFNWLPKRYLEADPLFTSVYVANLGSLGLDAAYHHLYETGTCGLFATLGVARKMLFVGADGAPQVRDGLQVRWTVDTRVADGLYNSVCLRMIQSIMEDPARFVGEAAADLASPLHPAPDPKL